MTRPIRIQQPTPKPSSNGLAIVPIGTFCNQKLQSAKIGATVRFETEWRRDVRRIVNICRFRINTPEFTFMLRNIYGENMTIAKLFERWEAWAVVEGIGKEGVSKDECLIIEVSDNLE